MRTDPAPTARSPQEPPRPPALPGQTQQRPHGGHRRDFPAPVAPARAVGRAHAGPPGCPSGLAAPPGGVRGEPGARMGGGWVRSPMMPAGGPAIIASPIACMADKRAGFPARPDGTGALARGCRPPGGPCAAGRTPCARPAHVLAGTREHARSGEWLPFPERLPGA